MSSVQYAYDVYDVYDVNVNVNVNVYGNVNVGEVEEVPVF